jgi:hypothetical protein
MSFKRRVTNIYENDEAPEIEFELSYAPDEYTDTKFVKLAETFVIGYLVHDESCTSPFEWDDSKIVTSSRRNSSTDDHRAMQKALGLDSDWEPDLDTIYDFDCGTRQLVVDDYIEYFVDNTSVDQLISIGYERDDEQEIRLANGSTSTPDYWFKIKCAEQDVNDGCDVFPEVFEAIQLKFWKAGIEAGTIGNKYAVSLDVYEHSGISFSVSGEGMQCRWDTARGGALWIPSDEEIENIKIVALRDNKDEMLVAREFARGAAEEYTSWCNGDCYGVTVATYDAQGVELDSDECWGYIGREYAEQALKETFDSHTKADDAVAEPTT